MYQRNLNIQKGLKNRVQIQFKNSDQKLVPVNTGSFVFTMFDEINQTQLVRKVINVVDDGVTTSTKGLAVLELNESDTLDIATGFYKFTVSSIDNQGSYNPTYANTYYGISGAIEVRQDSFPILQPSQESNSFQTIYNNEAIRWEYYSGNLDAKPQFNGNTALHTIAIYLTNYKGQIIIQGTQNNTPGFFGDYADIQTLNYNGTSGIVYVNFNGVFSFVRVKHIPKINPVSGNNNFSENAYHGTLDKVLYRS
jgi:hypothetical protein